MGTFSKKNIKDFSRNKALLIGFNLLSGFLFMTAFFESETKNSFDSNLKTALLMTIVYGLPSTLGILLLKSKISKEKVLSTTLTHGFLTFCLGSLFLGVITLGMGFFTLIPIMLLEPSALIGILVVNFIMIRMLLGSSDKSAVP